MRKTSLLHKLALLVAGLAATATMSAQAPANAPDVMLQGFYWGSYSAGADGYSSSYGLTTWSKLLTQVDEISESFSLVWLPPSAASEDGMGYHPKQWCKQDSKFGDATGLKELISAFKANGTRCVADIVINHKSGNNWLDLDNEDFGDYGKFTLYEAGQSSYICCDDEATSEGYKCLGANDAGYEALDCRGSKVSGAYCAARDLDHSNAYLRSSIKAYLQWMKDVMGFDGWRYDLVKGYLGKYTNEYNTAAGAYMSVGEYWDGNYDAVKYWINQTSQTSMAFDFPMKYDAFNNALASNNYAAMAVSKYSIPRGLCGADEMKRFAVTFVDNHDTFRNESKFTGDWTKANAYIIAAPGIPCVFYPHWVACKADIKNMIAARKACGIHSQSACTTDGTCSSYYKCTTTGTNGTLICFIGGNWSAPSGYTLACSGSGWAYYTKLNGPAAPVVTMSPTGGYVGEGGKVTLTTTAGTIYYTTDGTTPSATSTKYTGAITISTNKTVVKAIAIDGTTKSSVVAGTFLTEQPAGVKVQFSAPSSWSKVNVYAWDSNENTLAGEWPGTAITKNGDYYEYTFTGAEAPINVIFNNGTQQTADLVASEATNCWDASSWSSTDTKKIPATCGGEEPVVTTYNIMVKKSGVFATTAPYAYCWGGYTNTWPGEQMTDAGNGWWVILNKCTGTQNIIFNDGNGNQTGNIEGIKSKTCYEVTSLTKGSSDATSVSCPSPTTNIDEAATASVSVFPNPATDKITIIAEEEVASVIIRSLGAKVEIEAENSSTIDISSLVPGMYFATIRLANEQVVTRKIIKK